MFIELEDSERNRKVGMHDIVAITDAGHYISVKDKDGNTFNYLKKLKGESEELEDVLVKITEVVV